MFSDIFPFRRQYWRDVRLSVLDLSEVHCRRYAILSLKIGPLEKWRAICWRRGVAYYWNSSWSILRSMVCFGLMVWCPDTNRYFHTWSPCAVFSRESEHTKRDPCFFHSICSSENMALHSQCEIYNQKGCHFSSPYLSGFQGFIRKDRSATSQKTLTGILVFYKHLTTRY